MPILFSSKVELLLHSIFLSVKMVCVRLPIIVINSCCDSAKRHDRHPSSFSSTCLQVKSALCSYWSTAPNTSWNLSYIMTSWGALDVVSVVVHDDSLHRIKRSIVAPDARFCSWRPTSVRSGCYQTDITWSEPKLHTGPWLAPNKSRCHKILSCVQVLKSDLRRETLSFFSRMWKQTAHPSFCTVKLNNKQNQILRGEGL